VANRERFAGGGPSDFSFSEGARLDQVSCNRDLLQV
jgi:hypothetical protein